MALAIGFTCLLNVLIVATLVWPEWLTARVKFASAATVIGIWIAALWETRRELRRHASQKATAERCAGDLGTNSADPDRVVEEQNDALLRQAQGFYLQGDWIRSEDAARRILRKDRRDIEAQLLLASILRRSNRVDAAKRRLERLKLREDANRWLPEISRELTLLDRELGVAEPEKLEENSSASEAA